MKKIYQILTFILVFAAFSAGAEVVRSTHTFAIVDKDTLRLDRYVDNSVRPDSAGYPTMIYIHGGGFVGGSRVNAAQQFYANNMAKNGWQVLLVNYRLAGYGNVTTEIELYPVFRHQISLTFY